LRRSTQVLFARDDQAGGRKRVGAALTNMFTSSIRLAGKLRVRMSTLPRNVPLNLSMPLQGERCGSAGSRALLGAGVECQAIICVCVCVAVWP
jgi:hypothetical protein